MLCPRADYGHLERTLTLREVAGQPKNLASGVLHIGKSFSDDTTISYPDLSKFLTTKYHCRRYLSHPTTRYDLAKKSYAFDGTLVDGRSKAI